MPSPRTLLAALLLPSLAASSSHAQFQTSTGNAHASAECLIDDPDQLLYGYNHEDQPEFYPSLELARPLKKTLAAGGTAEALGVVSVDFPTPRRLVVSGSTQSAVDPGPTGAEAFAEGIAEFELRFSLPAGGSFLIAAGSLTASDGLSTLSIGTTEAGLVAFDSDSAEDPSGVTGPLPPGEYVVYVSARSSTELGFSSNPQASAAFSLDLRISPACTGDLNNDGLVELDDFFEFFNCFDADAGCADIDGVDGVDLGDYFAFLGSFDSGC